MKFLGAMERGSANSWLVFGDNPCQDLDPGIEAFTGITTYKVPFFCEIEKMIESFQSSVA